MVLLSRHGALQFSGQQWRLWTAADVRAADSGETLALPPNEQRIGKVHLTHSYETFLRSRSWVRIPSNGLYFLCVFSFVFLRGKDKFDHSFLWLFFTSRSRNVVYRGWTVSSECSQCCREMVPVSRGKFSGQTADPGKSWRKGALFRKTIKQTNWLIMQRRDL